MKMTRVWLGLPLLWLVSSCDTTKEDLHVRDSAAATSHRDDGYDEEGDEEGDEEEAVPLEQVPEAVKQAAAAAVPGFVASSAELESEHGTRLYSLSGRADGEEVEIEVTPEGKVLEIERGDDDDD